jgi:hypothetical protein
MITLIEIDDQTFFLNGRRRVSQPDTLQTIDGHPFSRKERTLYCTGKTVYFRKDRRYTRCSTSSFQSNFAYGSIFEFIQIKTFSTHYGRDRN